LTRFKLRDTLPLLLIYLLAVGGLVWWSHLELRAGAERLAEQTARLLGREIAAAVRSAMPDRVPAEGTRPHRELLETVRAVAARSAVVEAVSLIGPDGRVAASADPQLVGRERPTPDELFASDPRARLADASNGGLATGHYTMEIPLFAGSDLTGYLSITIASEELSSLYFERRRRVFLLAAAALVLIGLLGYLLHLQVAQRGRRLGLALDAALSGEAVAAPRPGGRSDPFAEALATAGKVGRELAVERRKAARVEQRLAQLGEILDVGVVLLGPEKELDFASPRARELLGLGPDDERWELPERLSETVTRSWEESLNGLDAEVLVQLGGRSRRLGCQVHPLDAEECVGWLLLVRDASLLRLLEIDLRRAARLRVLSQVYLAVAHDLKAPLNGMVLNLELLRESLADHAEIPRDRQRRWVEVLERELVRLRRSLETLLAQTAPTREEPERFDLRATVAEIEDLLAPQARHQQARLVTELPDQPVAVRGHRDHLKQAVLNVAINGLEVLAESGTLTIELRQGEEGVAALAVRDTGPGIPPELRARIFDMHFTTKESGTGIGLYVARSIVESEGGTLTIAETGPEGTTFAIRVPLADDSDDSPEEVSA
jgi:signal transduction histidine kinase